MGSARKFPNFPTMSLPQTPGNIFQSAISQPSPFSEHAPSDSPFGNGMLSQRRATLANTDASVLNSNLSNATNPFGSSSNFTSSQAGPFGSTTNQQLPQLMEEGSPDEDTAMETSSPPAGDAPNSFANFSFNDGNGPSPFNEPSPFQANKLPPQAISSGSAQASADELRPPSYALSRRTSVSAESLVPNHATFGASSQSENVTDPGNTEPKPNVPKSDSQLLRIRQAIGQNFLFRNLDEEQEKDVLAAMREVQVKQGEVVIEQGATGDFFYVVEAGDFDIFKRDDRTDQQTDPAPTEQTRGKKVHTAGPGGSFGELALMYKYVDGAGKRHAAMRANLVFCIMNLALPVLQASSLRVMVLFGHLIAFRSELSSSM
jgi:cAMP-dependent protein kinase regulator